MRRMTSVRTPSVATPRTARSRTSWLSSVRSRPRASLATARPVAATSAMTSSTRRALAAASKRSRARACAAAPIAVRAAGSRKRSIAARSARGSPGATSSAGDAVEHHLRDGADRRGDHRQPGGHRLQDDVRRGVGRGSAARTRPRGRRARRARRCRAGRRGARSRPAAAATSLWVTMSQLEVEVGAGQRLEQLGAALALELAADEQQRAGARSASRRGGAGGTRVPAGITRIEAGSTP